MLDRVIHTDTADAQLTDAERSRLRRLRTQHGQRGAGRLLGVGHATIRRACAGRESPGTAANLRTALQRLDLYTTLVDAGMAP